MSLPMRNAYTSGSVLLSPATAPSISWRQTSGQTFHSYSNTQVSTARPSSSSSIDDDLRSDLAAVTDLGGTLPPLHDGDLLSIPHHHPRKSSHHGKKPRRRQPVMSDTSSISTRASIPVHILDSDAQGRKNPPFTRSPQSVSSTLPCNPGEHRYGRRFGKAGIIAAVVAFPFGLIYMFCDSEVICKHCGLLREAERPTNG